jgi:hypothetical protein
VAVTLCFAVAADWAIVAVPDTASSILVEHAAENDGAGRGD